MLKMLNHDYQSRLFLYMEVRYLGFVYEAIEISLFHVNNQKYLVLAKFVISFQSRNGEMHPPYVTRYEHI